MNCRRGREGEVEGVEEEAEGAGEEGAGEGVGVRGPKAVDKTGPLHLLTYMKMTRRKVSLSLLSKGAHAGVQILVHTYVHMQLLHIITEHVSCDIRLYIGWTLTASPVTVEPCTGPVAGPEVSTSRDPLEMFSHFFNEGLLDTIVGETNRFAAQSLAASNANRTWETCIEEVKAYFGFMVVMGINRLLCYDNSTSTKQCFCT